MLVPLILSLLTGTELAGAGCPALSDLAVAAPDHGWFYGARYYRHTGHPVPGLACNGAFEVAMGLPKVVLM